MKKAILATKVGMTQIFNYEDGVLIPVTVLQAGPCVVTQVKTVENDGYSAVQVGYVDKKDKIVTKDGSGRKAIAHRNGVTKAPLRMRVPFAKSTPEHLVSAVNLIIFDPDVFRSCTRTPFSRPNSTIDLPSGVSSEREDSRQACTKECSSMPDTG